MNVLMGINSSGMRLLGTGAKTLSARTITEQVASSGKCESGHKQASETDTAGSEKFQVQLGFLYSHGAGWER